jgi:membrane-bound metal-dependent hydrolase YbcI (DUF457 family)
MYAGHFAAALAIKAKEPRAPTWALLFGVGFLDVQYGIYEILRIHRFPITPGVSPGFTLDFLDWSHSLALSLAWAGLFSIPFWRGGREAALDVGFAVFSHFLLDLPMHPPDLALWPHSTVHLGLGLWKRLPTGWWWVELAVIALFCAYYVSRARAAKTFGGRALWACAVILALHLFNSPSFSPAR